MTGASTLPSPPTLSVAENAPCRFPAGPWQVVSGKIEVYLVWARGRRLLYVAAPDDLVISPEPDSRIEVHGVAIQKAQLQPARMQGDDLRKAERIWRAAILADPFDPRGEDPIGEHVDTTDPVQTAEFLEEIADNHDRMSALQDARELERLRPQNAGVLADPQHMRALRRVAEAVGMKPADLKGLPASSDDAPVQAQVRSAGLRARRVVLEADWTQRNQGPLLVRHQADDPIKAYIWQRGAYRDEDGAPVDGGVTAARAYSVYASLPREAKGVWSLARFALFTGSGHDIVTVIVAAAGVALLGILIPLATAWLLSDVVPSGNAGLLMAVGIALGVAALISMTLSTGRAIATARIGGRGAMRLGAGLTDRLLRLPVAFFKDFSAGDLNQRIEAVDQLRELGVSLIMSAGLTAILSIVYLGVLLGYDFKLAVLAFGLVSLYILAVVFVRFLQIEPIREAAAIDGQIAGLTYETLEGVAKLRVSAAEGRAMHRWHELYVRERMASLRAGRIATHFGAFSDAYQTVTLMALFAAAGAYVTADTEAGIFIGFLAAFGAFQSAFVGLSDALLQVYTAQPLVERARPILEAEPEIGIDQRDPGTLNGEIEVSGLSFAYGDGSVPVLINVDLRIRAGEHVAIVGGSGSGKSTFLRLLLGFEKPQRGSIVYDGQDLSHLDLTRVRGQIGVVLQSSQLFADSILGNIRGAGTASLADCLEAAEQAGLSPDLEQFAMGIHTPITEGASALSGGQRQRILIARALAAKPRLLFFDEATSALDNVTQAIVARTLDQLKITRITIAHRLSTVRNADTICVLEDGRIAEQGTYQDLMQAGGVFAHLAKRQLIEE